MFRKQKETVYKPIFFQLKIKETYRKILKHIRLTNMERNLLQTVYEVSSF